MKLSCTEKEKPKSPYLSWRGVNLELPENMSLSRGILFYSYFLIIYLYFQTSYSVTQSMQNILKTDHSKNMGHFQIVPEELKRPLFSIIILFKSKVNCIQKKSKNMYIMIKGCAHDTPLIKYVYSWHYKLIEETSYQTCLFTNHSIHGLTH